MCWACYTPLSGGVAGSSSAPVGSGRSAPSATSDGEEKKAIPPWQMAVIGIGLLVAIGAGVKSMMPASTGDDMGSDIPTTEPFPAGDQPAPPSTTAVVSPAPGGTVSVTPTEAPFKVIVPPNPRTSVATIAIVTSDKDASGPVAASYAAYVRRQYAGQLKNWHTLYIYVFSDTQSAQAFAQVMKRRRGAALSSNDLASYTSIWSGALARYEYSVAGGKRIEKVLYPSNNPSGWWRG